MYMVTWAYIIGYLEVAMQLFVIAACIKYLLGKNIFQSRQKKIESNEHENRRKTSDES